MFGRKTKRIRELEYTVARRDTELRTLKHNMTVTEDKLKHIRKLLDSTPTDCTPGRWCGACTFGKGFHIYDANYETFEIVYLCTREKTCKNFIQKTEEKNERKESV